MAAKPEYLIDLIKSELSDLKDGRLVNQIREGLISPALYMGSWEYDVSKKHFPYWTVFEHNQSGAKIAYCEHGHGPRYPWGLMSLTDKTQSMGPDSNWFSSFLGAYFNCFAITHLDIWRVFRTTNEEGCFAISAEASWEDTWAQVLELRKLSPELLYDCNCDAAVQLNI